MADEPISMTDRLLRDIQVTLSQHTRLLTEQGTNIRDMRREMHGWRESTATALGFAAHANVRLGSPRKQVDALTERLDQLERQH